MGTSWIPLFPASFRGVSNPLGWDGDQIELWTVEQTDSYRF